MYKKRLKTTYKHQDSSSDISSSVTYEVQIGLLGPVRSAFIVNINYKTGIVVYCRLVRASNLFLRRIQRLLRHAVKGFAHEPLVDF